MVSPFQMAAPKLYKNIKAIIPLMPRSKRPSIERWSEYGVTAPDENTIQRWLQWKDSNIGVCLGVASNLIAIDYDYDEEGLHQKIKSLIPPSPIGKVGEKGATYFYIYNGQRSSGFSKNGKRVLDILSQGRQTVLPPSIHDKTGQPYRWITERTLEDFPVEDLPHFPQQAIYDLNSLFKVEQKIFVPQPSYTEVYADTTTQDITDALEYIDPDDYNTWIMVGMTLKDKIGERGFLIWDKWSQSSQKYKPFEMQTKWNSFRGHGLTISSLFYLAMDMGYVNVPASVNPETVTEDFILNGKKTGIPKSETVSVESAPLVAPPKQTDSLVFPSELLRAPGLPGKLADYINRTSLIPQPVLALGAAIAAAGSLMGRKVRSDTNLRTNFYIIGLAPSGSGKDHARTVLKRLFHDTGLGDLELGVPASSAGLIGSLRERGQGRGIILWDEFGRVLKQISGWRSGTHERDIVTSLIELFSSAQSVYLGKAYANHDGKNPMRPIDQPCLSIYATSVPGHFYEALSGGEAIDGFLARWLIFESKDYTMEEEDHEQNFAQAPQHMIDICKFWKEQPFNYEEKQGNMGDTIKTVPRLIKCSAQAADYLKSFTTEMRKTAMARELAGDPTGAIWSRAGEHARRLALVAHEGEEITLKVAEWGVSMSRYCCNYMASAISDYISSTELEAQTKSMLRAIREKSKVQDVWVTKADISRAFQGIQARVRNEILMSLVERGEILVEKSQGSKGAPTWRYKAS